MVLPNPTTAIGLSNVPYDVIVSSSPTHPLPTSFESSIDNHIINFEQQFDMNYVPLNRGREQSPSSPGPFHNSSTLYINQQRPVLHLPRPRFNVTVNGHLQTSPIHHHHHHQQQQQHHLPHRTHDFSRITIRAPDIRPPRTPMPFHNVMSTPRANTPAAPAIADVHRKLAALTLRLEKELESEATVDEYYGQCTKCGEPVTSASEACQAMDELYHNDCFKCVVCSRTLRGKAFYRVQNQVYCEEDYLFTGFQQTVEKCYICDHLIMDKMLQALGNTYHPGCFRCTVCNECLDGLPFTINKERRLFCLYDYHNTYAPRCAKCAFPICPEEGSDESIRVVAMNKNFHVDCYRCEDCQCSLSNEQTTAVLGGCCPLEDGTLLCYRCRIRRAGTSDN
ncbi:unnamed protein product [Adineta ricciae]|uniref:LIM zinc-binding domain-containing protein n=1 Tax=Adineta ricciae TaxID=249248 RepID=A0A814ZHI7_ADIRI|nr:unnamed protein product [Adineta ricciae]CAF1245447.1 unnamed protein product [Adineta ricciae]